MSIWALSDPHLSFGLPQKSMEAFGPKWKDYTQKIASHWNHLIQKEDLVLIPGDISWAMHLCDALIDLEWIDALPGTKVILKGNHDFWWPSNQKLQKALPPSIHFVHNNAFHWNEVTIGGSRLWDSEEYSFDSYISFQKNLFAKSKTTQEKIQEKEEAKKIFQRELERLKLSLNQLNPSAKVRIALTHYPPISADLKPSATSKILEDFHIDYCVFGHLHNVKESLTLFGMKNGIHYYLTSCDYLQFSPIRIL